MVFETLRSQRGGVALLTGLAISALIGFTALVVDIGLVYLSRAQLSNMTDSAALAGAQELPFSPDRAGVSALDYASRNGLPADDVEVAIEGGNTRITVSATRTVNLLFAKIFGLESQTVGAKATAAVKTLSGATGVVPFAVVRQEFIYGQPYKLKLGAGEGYNGNFGALALGGRGADNYRNNIKYGYQGKLQIVDWVPLLVETEPGNMSGPTQDGVNYRKSLDPAATFETVKEDSPRNVIVPVIESLDGNGRETVQIVGFAAFFLEGVGGSGNECYVTGRFIQTVVPGTGSDNVNNYGLYTSYLVK